MHEKNVGRANVESVYLPTCRQCEQLITYFVFKILDHSNNGLTQGEQKIIVGNIAELSNSRIERTNFKFRIDAS